MEKITNEEFVPTEVEAVNVENHVENIQEKSVDVVPPPTAETKRTQEVESLRQNILNPDNKKANEALTTNVPPPPKPVVANPEEKKRGEGGVWGSKLGKILKGSLLFFGGLFALGISQAFAEMGSLFKNGSSKGKGGGGNSHGGGGSHAKSSSHAAPANHAASGHKKGGGGGHH